MSYYHNLITEQSWQQLLALRKKYDFILIGGWAVFLWTHALKSKDIDLVLEYPELEKMRAALDMSKNERLQKYEARRGEIEIDIYLPFYSNPGLPAEELLNLSVSLEGFKTVEKEILAILKQKALLERAESVKGRKDLIDLVSLFRLEDFNWLKYKKVIRQYNLENSVNTVKRILKATKEINELELNVHQMAGLKKKILPRLVKS